MDEKLEDVLLIKNFLKMEIKKLKYEEIYGNKVRKLYEWKKRRTTNFRMH